MQVLIAESLSVPGGFESLHFNYLPLPQSQNEILDFIERSLRWDDCEMRNAIGWGKEIYDFTDVERGIHLCRIQISMEESHRNFNLSIRKIVMSIGCGIISPDFAVKIRRDSEIGSVIESLL